MRAEELEFDVDNMSCGSCIARVEAALTAQPGVLRASANLTTGRVQADVSDPRRPCPGPRADTAGYPATPVTDTATPDPQTRDKPQEARALARRFGLAFALTLPVFVVEMGGHLVPPVP